METSIFGRLSLQALKHDAIEVGANLSMVFAALLAIGLLTYFKKWKWLWREWLTSLDPKKIGIMYLFVVLIMLFKGLTDAFMMRAQQMLSVGESQGYLGAEHFQQVFTAHGATMIFFVGMGIVFALTNLIMPLQIGARDVAFPFLNSISFWLFAAGGSYIMLSLMLGEFAGTGWVSYPPLSGIKYSPGVGVDYWIWTVQIAGVGSLLSGVNFLVTILKMRCPGMTLRRMPIFTWSILATMILIIFAFPVLTATVGMLSLDRLFGTHFFTADFGGNPMMYVNLIWAWGHPEVYILILPIFGIFSEVVATFSQKRLFGYTSMIWAILAITLLSFIVWLHHFFTMGAGANVNAFFGIMTMLIAIPTGVKIFNWIFTMFRGRVIMSSAMLWFLGFVIIFTVGGMAGVLLSVAPIDFQSHNSLFLVAHFHSMVIGGVVFGFFSGFTYWFPKFAGYKLNEKIAKQAFWCWFIGFFGAFTPLYLLGFMGATRRLNHYEAGMGWQPMFIVAGIGAALIAIGMALQIKMLIVSYKERNQNLDTTGDPWHGRTLEWSTTSPPPHYNFAIVPEVHEVDAFWEMKKHQKEKKPAPVYEPIHMPKDSSIGLLIGACAFFVGFGFIWHMVWMLVAGIVGIIILMIIRLSDPHTDHLISVEEIKKTENERFKKVGHI